MSWFEALERKAGLRARAGLARSVAPRTAHDGMIDLAGNDYLGLSAHPDVLAAASAALGDYGLGATGSRLVRGSTAEHDALETELADLLRVETALVYSSGYLANLGVLRALARPGTLLVLDGHAHASLIDGCRLTGAETVTVPHSSPQAVAEALREAPGRPAIVVVESVYSVDGDLAPLAELHAVCRAAGALLLVDEAHAVGVIGPAGAGGVVAAGLAGEPDIVVTATLSKALGGAGGVVAGPAALRRHLVDTGRTFIFDTALPPAIAAGVRAALRLARAADDRRALLHSRAALAADTLGVPAPAAGVLSAGQLGVPAPPAGVLSIVAPGAAEALAWATACRDAGVAVGCFRPPSTPDRTSRLRLTVNAGLPDPDFDKALHVIAATRP